MMMVDKAVVRKMGARERGMMERKVVDTISTVKMTMMDAMAGHLNFEMKGSTLMFDLLRDSIPV